MGDPARPKTGENRWGGSPGLQFCAPDSLGSSASPGTLYCPPGTGRREDAFFPGPCQETDARIWETEVRTKPQ